MAMELCKFFNCNSLDYFLATNILTLDYPCIAMHKAWPRLLRRMKGNKTDSSEDRELVIASRTWFCLYLFEHQ